MRVHPGSLMVMGTGPHAASEKAIAIRWSSYVLIAALTSCGGAERSTCGRGEGVGGSKGARADALGTHQVW